MRGPRSPGPYLQIVSVAALAAEALHLERRQEVDGDTEAWSDHDVPAAVQARQVVLGVAGAAEHPSVGMQETPTPCPQNEEIKHLQMDIFFVIVFFHPST